MRSLFLMSVFGLFMISATSGPSLANITLAVPAYASDNPSIGTQDSDDEGADFHCPNGITTCYKADGTEFTDVNNLQATAAGSDSGESDSGESDSGESDSGESSVGSNVLKPVHFRTF